MNIWKRAVWGWVWKWNDVSDDSDTYFSDKSDIKTIDSVASDEHLDYSASPERLYISFNAESLQRKHKKTATSQKIYIPPV